MQDRVPVNPGRVLITPENGSAAFYATMARADNPTQEGTPLNKANLLKDATAALFGLGADAVPDDVLSVLSRFQKGLGNEYVWEKLTVVSGYREVRTNVTGDSIYTVKGAVYTYSDAINIDQSTGAVSLVNPSTITQGSYDSATVAEAIANKYFTVSAESGLFYCITTNSTQGNQLYVTVYDTVTSEAYTGVTSFGYVNSPNPEAYPVNDGYTYMALGQLGNKVRIATGSYKGAGTYGASNPNSLTFDFNPKFVLVWRFSGVHIVSGEINYSGSFIILSKEAGQYVLLPPNTAQPVTTGDLTSFSIGTTTSWYGWNVASQNNANGDQYNYIAIG